MRASSASRSTSVRAGAGRSARGAGAATGGLRPRPQWPRRAGEPVAAPGDGRDQLVTEHLAQGRDLDGEVGLFDDQSRPDGVEQFGLGQQLAGTRRHRQQQVEGARTEGHGRAVCQQSALLWLQLEATEAEASPRASDGCAACEAPQHSRDTGMRVSRIRFGTFWTRLRTPKPWLRMMTSIEDDHETNRRAAMTTANTFENTSATRPDDHPPLARRWRRRRPHRPRTGPWSRYRKPPGSGQHRPGSQRRDRGCRPVVPRPDRPRGVDRRPGCPARAVGRQLLSSLAAGCRSGRTPRTGRSPRGPCVLSGSAPATFHSERSEESHPPERLRSLACARDDTEPKRTRSLACARDDTGPRLTLTSTAASVPPDGAALPPPRYPGCGAPMPRRHLRVHGPPTQRAARNELSCAPETADDRPVRSQAPRRLPPRAQGALRHRRLAVRRPRRVDQHHAAHPPGHGRGGHPPRPQPLGGRDRHRGAAGRRAGHRDQQLPGRARRVLQVHDRPAQGTRRRAHQGVRRRRRRDRGQRDQGAARLRRGAHLLARGRAEARPAGNDRLDPAPRPTRTCRAMRPSRSTRCATAT